MTTAKWLAAAFLLLIVLVVGSAVVSYVRNSRIPKAASRPAERYNLQENRLLWKLENDEPIELADIKNIKAWVDGRYDCSDFRLQSITRILFDHGDKLSDEAHAELKQMLLGFKYWMDEPGRDGMCYWSENHQILFAASEYLAGTLYPRDVFANNGMTGEERKANARKRILTWLEQRWKYGFTEWYSNTYYVEDIAPLSNLIDFADDEEIVAKSKIILDLLLYDIASQSYKGTFVTTSGRMYERGRKSGARAGTRAVTEALFGDGQALPGTGMDLNFLVINNYEVPEVIRAIGRHEETVIVKASNGLDISELAGEGLIGQENHQIMMQWAMEAFSNPEVIANTVEYVERNDMFPNAFLHAFKTVNYPVLKWLDLLPTVSRVLNPQSNGVAIQRANTYTYRTPHYSMYTAQGYHPGEYGSQHHVFGITLSEEVSLFHTNPAMLPGERGAIGNSPNYWVGYGHLPHSVQDANVNLSIYSLPESKGLMEKRLIDYTHLYFPRELFDEVTLEGNRLFASYRGTHIAFIGKNELRWNPEQEDIIQEGKVTWWIAEASTSEAESFDQFVGRVSSNSVRFENNTLTYGSAGKSLSLAYNGDFRVHNRVVSTDHPRYDSPYIVAERDPEELTFEHDGQRLYLNFNKMIREVSRTTQGSLGEEYQ